MITLIKIDEQTLREWDEHFLPPFDLVYLDEAVEELPEDILIMPVEELKANPSLYNIDVRTTFEVWNVDKNAKYVAIIKNEQFDQLDDELKQRLLQLQFEYGRGNLLKWKEIKSYIEKLTEAEYTLCQDLFEKMSFQVSGETWIALRRNHWKELPWSCRKNILIETVKEYSSEAIVQRVSDESIELTAFIRYYANQFPTENGPNCFAAALSAITANRDSAEWVIHQWIHPKTFILGLEQRGYAVIDQANDWKMVNLQRHDVVVWVNEEGTPVHAAAAISDAHAFNKDGQTMYNPWLIRRFDELAPSWDDVIGAGGKIHHYRKVYTKNCSD